jgi:hypothetical protein
MKKLAIHVTPAIRSGKKVGFGGQKTARVEAANDTVDEEDLDVVAD